MTVWCHLPTILNRRYILRTAGIISLCVALITTLLFSVATHAAAGVNQTLSFQGRLLNSSGSAVPDGYYNIQFKIYQDGTGTTAGDTGGILDWTETYLNNGGNNGVYVQDGFFSVNLGSQTPFGTSVDWNDDTLWLSMNVAGSSTSCTTFNSGTCVADGEMLPMRRITSTPYAMNSGELGGKTASNFVQLGQGVQTDATTNTSSIFINKTSTGNLVELQNAATDIFTIGNAGDLTFGNNADKTISVTTAAASSLGNSLTVEAGGGGSGTGSSGGNLILQGGAAGGTNGTGGNVAIDAGAGTGTGAGGTLSVGTANASTITIGSTTTAVTQTISIGANNTAGSTANVTIGAGGSAAGGTTSIQSKGDTTISTNGTQQARFSSTSNTLYVGNADTSGSATTANGFTIQGTSSTGSNVQGGSLAIQSGSATSGNANGGNLTLSAGSGVGTGAAGLVVLNTPAFQTASEQDFAANGGLTQASIDGNGAVITKATATGLTLTVPNPTITTAGRIVFVTAASASDDFTLSMNSGAATFTMHKNSTVTLVWNGSAWTTAGTSNTTTLQDVYNNTIQSTSAANLTLSSGLVIGGSASGTLMKVQDSSSNALFSVNSGTVSNVQIGTGAGTGTPTLLTVDNASSAPTLSGSSLTGSMYFDTTLGELQCYNGTGWGNCTNTPDTFVSLSPTYANAVTHGTGTGTLSTDMCSDTLNINNGTSSQPSVCSTHETYNYYNWTSTQTSAQTKTIYVTYQLPSNFKNFVAGQTSLMAKTDSTNASASYQIYRSDSNGLTACGSSTSASTGAQTTWQKASASGTADPSSCSFAAGDSIVIAITLSADNSANTYISNLNFAYSRS